MANGATPSYSPLFPLGFHHLTMADLEAVCVDQFPLSTTRKLIMHGFTKFVEKLSAAPLVGEIWVDGSFISEKIDPKDIDVVLRCPASLYDAGTEAQRTTIDWVIANQKDDLLCDSYMLFDYPIGHPLHEEGEWWYSYWHAKWGFSRPPEHPKGIVVIVLYGTGP